MSSKVVVFVLVLAMSGMVVPAFGMDEYEYVAKLRALELKCAGAAESSKARFAEAFASEVIDSTIHVSSAEVGNLVDDGEFPSGSIERGGASRGVLEHAGYYGPEARHRRGAWAYVFKNYQDMTISFLVLLNSPTLIDQFRKGQKVSFTGRISGLGDHSRDLVVIDATITPETTMLRCANGHEYAPSAGYKFCPQDGLPLK